MGIMVVLACKGGPWPVFEILKLKHKIGKADYKAQAPALRGDLIDVQFDLLEAGEFPVVVLLAVRLLLQGAGEFLHRIADRVFDKAGV